MPAWLMSAVRTAIQSGWGLAAAWLVSNLGVTLPRDAPEWLTGAAIAGVTLVATAVIRWLESCSPTTPEGRMARLLARVLMLGNVRAPSYPSSGRPA